MRKHGCQLPYHPLQVVAVSIFVAFGVAFYVFFAPFVGKKSYQYIVMGIYTPLIISAFSLYIWCAAADPADPGVFKSKKYLKVTTNTNKLNQIKESKLGGDSHSSITDAKTSSITDKPTKDITATHDHASENVKKIGSGQRPSCFMALLALFPCALICNEHDEASQTSEDGMLYCSLCEVEVFKYSKHCRVCDKCVDRFDHHCRWLNNCIGKKNYCKFFTLMVSALLVLILQWSTGILVLICCFVEHKKFEEEIAINLGSSFSLVPFVIVVAVCTILAMIATLPLVQLFFFHILLIKKGISTYDYIIALREQEQQGVGGQQSPQMSQQSSLTGLSSASSINTFHRGAWCTPPRLFLEDQYDVVPPDNGSVNSLGKKTAVEEPIKKKNLAPVKISPWALAHLNAEDVSKAAAEARKKSKVLQPVVRKEPSTFGVEQNSSFGSNEQRVSQRPDNNRKRASKHIRLPADLPLGKVSIDGGNKILYNFMAEPSTRFAPLQLEPRSAFRSSRGMSSSAAAAVASSPDSSLDSPSPDIHPFRASSSGTEEGRRLTGLPGGSVPGQQLTPLSRSTSDGYDASGGEDSDRVVPSRTLQRSADWTKLLFRSDQDERLAKFQESVVFGGSSVFGQTSNRNL